jgi:resolvase, N terminal domain
MHHAIQKLLKNIKYYKLDKILAIKTNRLSRDNFDDFYLLKYCEKNNIVIELTLEPYDITTANDEMVFGINLVFGQIERKEIGTE